MKLNKSVSAIITGGASGLGEAVTRSFIAAGVATTIFDIDRTRGEFVADEIGALFCECDVTRDANVEAAFAKSRTVIGQERILVNCAGGNKPMKTVSKGRPHSMEAFNWTVELCLAGTFRCIAQSAAGMSVLDPVNEDGERGCIVNTASAAGFEGQIGQVAYAAAKAGIIGMTLPLARDLAEYGIRVCTIAPGLFATPPLDNAPPHLVEQLVSILVFPQRFGLPEEFSRLVQHLCENSMLNGAVIRLDGSLRLPPK